MKALASLMVSVTPGAFRLLVVWLAAYLYQPHVAAPFTAMFLLATALCMISGGGFGLIAIRHTVGTNRNSKISITLFLLATAALTAAFMATIAAPFIAFELIPFMSITIVLSGWQIERHGWIAERKFLQLSVLDLLLLLLVILALWWTKYTLVTALVGSHLIIIGASFLLRIGLSKASGNIASWSWKLSWSALKIGGSTFIAGGFLMVMPALVESVVSPTTLTKLSLMVTAVGALFVVPRSYLNLFIGSLAKVVRAGKAHSKIVHTCMRRMRALGLIMLLPAIVFVLFYLILSGQQLIWLDVLLSSTVCSAMVIGQLYLVESNLLIFLKRENIALISSSLMFIVMLGLTWILGRIIEHDHGFLVALFFCLALCYGIRWSIYLKILKPYFHASHTNNKVSKA